MKTRLLELALEAEDNEPLVLDDFDDEIEDVLEDKIEVDSNANGIEQAVFAADQLTKIADVIDSQADQEVCPAVMDNRLLDVVLEGIYTQLGVTKPRELSMEANENLTWRDKTNRVKEQIGNILRIIVEALRRAYENLRSFLTKIFAVAASLEKYAAQQLRLIRTLRGSPTQDSYESSRLARALYCEDTNLKTTYERLFDLVEDAERSATSGYVQLVAKMIEDFVESKDITNLVNEFPKVFEKTFSNIFHHDPNHSIIDTAGMMNRDDIDVYTTAYLPGGYIAGIGIPKTIDSLGHFIFGIQRVSDVDIKDSQLKVLTIEEMKWALDSIVKMCSRIRRFEALERQNGSLVDQLTRATKKLKQSTAEISEKDSQFLRQLARIAPSLARGIHQQTFTFALSSFRSLAEHCKHSASFYSTAESV